MSMRDTVDKAIDRWLEAGVIDPAAATRLREFERQRKPAETGRLAVFAFGFGGLTLAAGVFLFVAAHWNDLSPWARFGAALATVAVLHLGAAAAARFSAALATTLHAVGTAAFGAGIFLSGQIFNLQAEWPEAFGLWAAGAAVAFVLLRDWPQALFVAVLAPAWLAAEWVAALPWYWMAGSRAVESVLPFGLTLLGVAYLGAVTPGKEAASRRAVARLGEVALVLGAIMLAQSRADGFPEAPDRQVPDWLLAAGWAGAIGLPLVLAWLLRRGEAWPVGVAALAAGLVVALDPAITWQRLAIYVVYAAASVGLVWWGLRDRQRSRVNAGVLGFVLTLLAFYFASLFDMLGRAFGLIGIGVLAIAVGWFAERTRRRLLARIEATPP